MVTVQTRNASALHAKIKRAIDAGQVVTWSYDGDGDFTHTPPQWRGKAWLWPTNGYAGLQLSFVSNKNLPTTGEVYGVLQGRLIERLLAHFQTDILNTCAN